MQTDVGRHDPPARGGGRPIVYDVDEALAVLARRDGAPDSPRSEQRADTGRETRQDAPVIVVGVDASRGSAAALRWAVAEAVAHGAVVHAVHVRRGGGAAVVFGEERALDELALSMDYALGPGEPPVPLVRRLVDGPAGPALCLAAEGAYLLVLGSHRRGLVGEALLGSVSRHCTRHAPCPVVVVPSTVADEAERVFPVAEMAGAPDLGHA